MQKQTNAPNSKASRKGDTSRTSSQGRKLSSGGNSNKKGDPEMDENTKSPVVKPRKTKGTSPGGR